MTRGLVIALVAAAVVIVALIVFLRMPGRSFRGHVPRLSDSQRALRDQLTRDVRVLAADIGERNVVLADSYERTAAYIEAQFRDAGYSPDRQTFTVEGVSCANIEAEVRGTSKDVVVIGAHYDSVDGSPGADDNASGVAALVALARMFAKETPKHTLRFVAFANEEPPYFQGPDMGSFRYAKRCHERGERVIAMVSIEAIAFFSDAPKSQQYPAMIEAMFPDTANFIAFASNVGSQPLLKRCMRTFRANATVPSEGAALPEAVTGIAWSDQWAFWQYGYPAVMVTDTALFRNPHYHTAHDTPETLDYDRLTRVVAGLESVVRDLSVR